MCESTDHEAIGKTVPGITGRSDGSNSRPLLEQEQDRSGDDGGPCLPAMFGVEFSEDELVVGPEEPVDISFREARFQIREMLGERKRHLDLRKQLKRFQEAQSIDDLADPWVDSVPLSFSEVSRDIAKSLSTKASKYGVQACAQVDALVYVNIPSRNLCPLTPKLDPIAAEELHRQGWRSVSMVFIPYSCVLVGNEGCPEFLRNKTGRVRRKWQRPVGWFDPE
ncbi:DUF1780 family protein [Rhizobium leguminosarum]|uniref:DUF1780 domain-containing protein n=1 Tax=Rhizobium TaxID=379 RepID=UPI001C960A3D|nr:MULTISPECIES: DUF1780 domain-containing protein [Rhizobium]MBY5565937.1 DUF1780 family protein [Rhizobium leguminosarum]MBY5573083.1 DUF1780 family protein [Rhizobium leguminosarum]UFW64438.1 DUF1780 domain-containing protein [Rhizobium laguerreae]